MGKWMPHRGGGQAGVKGQGSQGVAQDVAQVLGLGKQPQAHNVVQWPLFLARLGSSASQSGVGGSMEEVGGPVRLGPTHPPRLQLPICWWP